MTDSMRATPAAPARKEALFWDKAAEKYAASPVKDVAAYEKTLERTRAYLKPDDRVLEVGCGTGTTALKLADAVGHITASDVSRNMIAIAEEKRLKAGAENARFVSAPATGGGFEAGTFDAVLAFNFLHLVDDLDGTLKHLAGLVKPGGHLITKTVCLRQGAYRFFRPVIAIMRAFGRAPETVRFLSSDEVDAAIGRAGLTILETGDYPAVAHFVVARKG